MTLQIFSVASPQNMQNCVSENAKQDKICKIFKK